MEKINDYYAIGDLYSLALVSKTGSIDWLCLPHFDSPSLFARVLDRDGGSFAIRASRFTVSSQYVKDTAVVQFNFAGRQSAFKVRDFMVPEAVDVCGQHLLVRKFIAVKGRTEIKLFFNPRPDYAGKKAKITFEKKNMVLKANIGKDKLSLFLPEDSLVRKGKTGFEITISLPENSIRQVVLKYAISGKKTRLSSGDMEKKTIRYWKNWIKKGHFLKSFRDKLVRSAIALKLMQFYPTGAVVAAPTTSLPEKIGGERNWDYRYVWLRDANFTLYALYILGYLDEAEKFLEFIESITNKYTKKSFDISHLYTIQGNPVPKEKEIRTLSGYRSSRPVRTGNRARDQFQLDVYGVLIDTYYFASKEKIEVPKIHKEMILKLVRKINKDWQRPDNGIWEIRLGKQNFTYSKVMSWVGLSRVLEMRGQLGLTQAEIDYCQNLKREIYQWVWKNCYDPVNKTFRQSPLSVLQDATNLLFVVFGFLDKNDPLTKIIIEKTCQELVSKEIFVYRYLTKDGLKGGEGAFLFCTSWLISAWAILGETKKARKLFKKFEGLIDKSGLMSEEMDPETREYLGNFPQAFSHSGFIMSAYYLNKYDTI